MSLPWWTSFLSFAENTYEVKLKSSDQITYADDNNKNSIQLTVFGDNGSSGPIDLRPAEGDTKKFDVRSATLKKKAFDAGKVNIEQRLPFE